MIDFHSHILPNIDDGSTSMEESVKLIKEAAQAGFTGIISTSHYLQNYYECDETERRNLLNELAEQVKMANASVDSDAGISEDENFEDGIGDIAGDRISNGGMPKLYLGSEIYITTDIVDLLKEGKASTINGTNYVLFELTMNSKPLFAKEVVYKLIENGYKPIIAHPERYSYVKEDIEFVRELKSMGALFQSNYGSVIGMYGGSAKKTLKKLLKEDLISFLGSDVHAVGQIYPKVPKILRKLEKWISPEKLQELTTLNAEKVLES